MSELKEYLCVEGRAIERKDFICYRFTSATKSAPEACMEPVYLKSEADKVIAELKDKALQYKVLYKELCRDINTQERHFALQVNYQKYKRCLAMAKWCESEAYIHEHGSEYDENLVAWFGKWYERWLKIAKKFNEEK